MCNTERCPSADTLTSKATTTSTHEKNGAPWTTVERRRRSKSLTSLPRVSGLVVVKQEPVSTLMGDHATMTPADRERVLEQTQTTRSSRSRESERSTRTPLGDGHSTKDKGKTIDPRNWGNVGLRTSELDPDAQRRELAAAHVGQLYISPEVEHLLGDMSIDEQREALEFWNNRKVVLKQSRAPPSSLEFLNEDSMMAPTKQSCRTMRTSTEAASMNRRGARLGPVLPQGGSISEHLPVR